MWSSIVNMDWSLPCTERFQYRSRLVLSNRPAWMFQTSACMLSRQQSLVEAWEWHIRVWERFVAPNFQQQKNQTDLSEYQPTGTILKAQQSLIFSLWTSTNGDFCTNIYCRTDSRGNFLLEEQQKRKNGQETRNTPSVRGICVNFDLWWDTVRCAEMWASEHFPGRKLRCARRREAAPSRVGRPRLDWQAALTPW